LFTLLGLDCVQPLVAYQTTEGKSGIVLSVKPPDLAIRREQVNSYPGKNNWLNYIRPDLMGQMQIIGVNKILSITDRKI
jgi:hypothetical protein